MRNIVIYLLILSILAGAIFMVVRLNKPVDLPPPVFGVSIEAAEVGSPFIYDFSGTFTLYEAGEQYESADPFWWVNSGALMYSKDGLGNTWQGSLGNNSPWRLEYEKDNPADTNDGFNPQNIFRLILRSKWQNFSQQVYFKINGNNPSGSDNKNESNGLLLFGRYRNSNELYYAGLRVDGAVVIKKKAGGVYHVLDEKFFLPGKYSQEKKESVLPKNKWIGLRTDVYDTASSTVIKLFADVGRTGEWTLVAEGVDDGTKYGPIIDGPLHTGIRTDFMDVSFDDYRIENLI